MENELNEKFTPEQIEVIKKKWVDQPPAQCVGKCLIGGVFFSACLSCNWQEGEE